MLSLIFAVEKLEASQSQQHFKIQWPRPFLYIVWFQVLPAAHQVEQVSRMFLVFAPFLSHIRGSLLACVVSALLEMHWTNKNNEPGAFCCCLLHMNPSWVVPKQVVIIFLVWLYNQMMSLHSCEGEVWCEGSALFRSGHYLLSCIRTPAVDETLKADRT